MNMSVEGCAGCPLFVDDYADRWDECNHPDIQKLNHNMPIDITLSEKEGYSPNWCPLKQESLTLTFINNESR